KPSPALFSELMLSLHAYYQQTTEPRMPKQKLACQWTRRNQVTGKLALLNFANWILCFLLGSHLNPCYVYQIILDWFRWGHAFRSRRIGRKLRTARDCQGC